MKLQRLALVLSVVNLVLLVLWTRGGASAPALRARTVELVDAAGVVRSRLGVEPDGEVVFRLFDENGTIRVKLGAGDDGSGLVLLDEETEPGVQILARRAATGERPATTSVTLTGAGGRRRAITPSSSE